MLVPPGFVQAIVSLRWLALASLIALEAFFPSPGNRPALISLYAAIFIYTFGLSLYVWRFPEASDTAARTGIVFDTGAIAAGMLLTGHGREYLLLAFPVTALAGLLLGHGGGVLVSAIVAGAQFPAIQSSFFAPGGYLLWGVAALSFLGTATASAASAERLVERRRFRQLLADLRHAVLDAAGPSAAGEAALAILAEHFRAHTGSVMLFDPPSGRLETLAVHPRGEARREIALRLGEGVAGRVAQDGQAVLLTPESRFSVRPSGEEVGSTICVPLASTRGTLGVLNLNRHRPAPWFTQDDLEAAEAAAQQITGLLLQAQHERVHAAALSEAAEGFGEVSRALARDPAVLWPALLDVARSLTSAHFAILALEREDTGIVDIVGMRGIDARSATAYTALLLAASTQGEIRVARDGPVRDGIPTTVACVPLRAEGQALGAIGLGLGDRPLAPRLLHAVASHVAAAVHTARSAHRIADIGVVEERRRIAREMHDGLAQTIADALLQTDLSAMAAQAQPGQVRGDLQELRSVLEQAMRELREFMTELRREDRTDETLFAALEAMGREFGRRHQIQTSVVTNGEDTPLPSAIRHAVLAIVRQALTNIRAHARATTVAIRAEATEHACSVSVADNGVGFDLAAFRTRSSGFHHLGITSMEERASLVGGRLQIASRPGGGTTVTVHVPLGREHDEDSRAAG